MCRCSVAACLALSWIRISLKMCGSWASGSSLWGRSVPSLMGASSAGSTGLRCSLKVHSGNAVCINEIAIYIADSVR